MKKVIFLAFWAVLSIFALEITFAANGGNILQKNFVSIPLAFTENQGQWDEKVLFRANTGGATMWFTKNGATYQFTRKIPRSDEGVNETMDPIDHFDRNKSGSIESMAIKANFVGANPNPLIVGSDLMEYKCNYFIGNAPNEWHTDVPNYNSVVYEEIYSGIDLKYYGNDKQMEYDFIVSPGADPSQIAIKYDGAKSIDVNETGQLVVETDWGKVIEQRPYVYQIGDNRRELVECEYILIDQNIFGFYLPDGYNTELALVIDPVLSYSTYLGGGGVDRESWIAINDSGCVYLVGSTSSSDFPTVNPYQTDQVDYDVFVTKLNASGDGLLYSTYIGGGDIDWGSDIAVDTAGNAFITGITYSSDFPTQNPYQTDQGNRDIFITKLNSAGNGLIYSTYIGGGDKDHGYGIAVDDSGNAFVTGDTYSIDFPTVNPYQTNQYGRDAYILKLASTGDSLVYSTYLGGSSGMEAGLKVALDNTGNAHILGQTESTDFPTQNPYQTDQPDQDVFVTKINSTGDGLIFSTYLGGSGFDVGWGGICVDTNGNTFITGITYSSDFPTQNPFQLDQGGPDIFVTKFNSAGNGLVYSTYLGGDDREESYAGIDIDNDGYAYVVGHTHSINFPTKFSCQTDQGGVDGFLSKLSINGDSLIYSTYLGGSDTDKCTDVMVDSYGNAYVTGFTYSADFPTVNPYQTDQGDIDIFVSKLTDANKPEILSHTPLQNELNIIANSNITVTFDSDMDTATLNDSTFLVYGNYSGYKTGVINYYSGSNQAVFDPMADFYPGEIVTVMLTDGIENTLGVPLEDGIVWTFTVGVTEGSALFEDTSYVSNSFSPFSIAAADVDNNGAIDLVAGYHSGNQFGVWLNNGIGVFDYEIDLTGGNRHYSHLAIDFNRDGLIDLATTCADDDNFLVYFNNGDSTFTQQPSYSTPDHPKVIKPADFNGDGYNDLIVACLFDSVVVYLNNGDGSFALESVYEIPADYPHPSDVVTGDYNGDYNIDFIVLCETGRSMYVFLNNGDGTFEMQTRISDMGFDPTSFYTTNFNNDDYLDLIISNKGDGSDSDSILTMFYGQGDGTFLWETEYIVGNGPRVVSASDFDGDGDQDIIAKVAYPDPQYTALLLNTGNGHMIPGDTIFAIGGSYSLTPADFDNDGDMDFASQQSGIFILWNIKDSDNDGIADEDDNCPTIYNPNQDNSDNDSLGNACDNCPNIDNAGQEDIDVDSVGDICDNCPDYYNPVQEDIDLDGIGDSCDNISPLFIRASSPEAVNNRITPSTPFTILIWINNTSFNMDLTSGSFSFDLYSPDGSIESVIHDDQLGYLSTGSVLYLNDFDSCFELGIFPSENGWDSNLPDSVNFNFMGTNGLLSSNPDQPYIEFNMIIDEFGTFCIDSCTLSGNPDWDWLFMAEYSPVTFAGPYCWDIACQNDWDCDGVLDGADNCPNDSNLSQNDYDGDEIGDACDNCPTYGNPGQIDSNDNNIGDACTFEEETPTGQNIEIILDDVSIQFDTVLTSGATELTVTSSGPELAEFEIVPFNPPEYYNITTDITYSGLINICITYTDAEISTENEALISLQHYDGFSWIDITTSLDTINNIVCGITSTLSPFVLTIPSFICDCEPGNVNADETINIFDITYIISFLYIEGPAPIPYELCNGDPNKDCTCNIFDITYLISFLYLTGPPPCTCEEWIDVCGSPLMK